MIQSVAAILWAGLLLVLFCLPAAAGMAERLVGDWRLVSFVDTLENGERTYPYGQNPNGLFLYTRDGHVAIQIVKSPAPVFYGRRGADQASLKQLRLEAKSYMAYFGTYTFEETRGVVVHHVLAGNNGYAGRDEKRHFRLEGDRLVIFHEMSTPKGVVKYERVLERVKR